ncbi:MULTISPECIES: serine hydrolase [Pseudoalteromonas]|uniref:serine hydrolase n=1 Tax=Pseudoalteromonas TaxID=53246 RepID=UPI00083DA89B|nr:MULTISPECIES: serine hydrolase [Pseudoalteromonas]ODB35218.1 serine hydrolase [Pseudoalteromonas sp. BMB]QZO12480.1 serine hydrolase [Pseudoalteromonas piscicida]
MKIKQWLLTSGLVAASFLSAQASAAVNQQDVEAAVKSAMAKFNIPGLAIGIVEDGKVVMTKGFGVTHLNKPAKVNADTLFGIASNTKAFTAAALAMLIDQGKLSWDDKVTKHIPEFKLYDSYVTQEMTIRDLLSHRSGLGLGAGDLMIWPDTDKTMTELLAGISHLKPDSSFRSHYAYNNLMFVVAGEVVSRVSGKDWRDFVEQEMFTKLDMDDSKAGFSRIPANNSNWATGHIPMDGKLTPFFVNYLEDFRGAGAIASNVDDMTKWLQTQLEGGRLPSGEQLFSQEQQVQMWHPHITRIPAAKAAEVYHQQFRGYGLGWAVEDYFGYKKVGHGGGILGMVSQVAMIPEKKLGVVVLSNQQKYPALSAIINEVFEDALGLEDKDWVQIIADDYFKAQQEKYAKAGIIEVAKPQPALPLNNYTGTLTSAWYGDVVVEKLGKELRIDFTHTKRLKGKLEHLTGNTFVVRWDEPLLEADAYINFVMDKSQRVESAAMEFVNPEITDFSFDFHNLDLKAKEIQH